MAGQYSDISMKSKRKKVTSRVCEQEDQTRHREIQQVTKTTAAQRSPSGNGGERNDRINEEASSSNEQCISGKSLTVLRSKFFLAVFSFQAAYRRHKNNRKGDNRIGIRTS